MILSLPETTLGERDRGAWSHAGTDGTSIIQVGNRTETIEAQRNYGIRGNTPARFVCDGFSCPKRTSRALPPSREAGRPLHPKKAVGSRGGIRGPNSEARAAAFRGITKSAEWRTVSHPGHAARVGTAMVRPEAKPTITVRDWARLRCELIDRPSEARSGSRAALSQRS